MEKETQEIESIDIPLGAGNRTLRISLTKDSGGKPESIILASGFGGGESGEGFNRPHWAGTPLRIPGKAIDRLRDGLDALLSEEGP